LTKIADGWSVVLDKRNRRTKDYFKSLSDCKNEMGKNLRIAYVAERMGLLRIRGTQF
jgi:hypothetical protein